MKLSGTERENSADDSDIKRVGARLKSLRESKGETLDEISKITRIGKNYLEALEAGDSEKLPSTAYTRGFIRLYSSHLGLSPEEALSMLAQAESEPAAVEAAGYSLSRGGGDYRQSFRRLLPAALLVLALLAAYSFFKPVNDVKPAAVINSSQATPPEKMPPGANKPVELLETAPAPLQPQTKENEPQPRNKEWIILGLKAVSDGRVLITIDDAVSQEYNLVAGDLVEWKAENNIMLDLDNAASVEGELDGKKLSAFGEPGRAAHLKLDSTGVHKQ